MRSGKTILENETGACLHDQKAGSLEGNDDVDKKGD